MEFRKWLEVDGPTRIIPKSPGKTRLNIPEVRNALNNLDAGYDTDQLRKFAFALSGLMPHWEKPYIQPLKKLWDEFLGEVWNFLPEAFMPQQSGIRPNYKVLAQTVKIGLEPLVDNLENLQRVLGHYDLPEAQGKFDRFYNLFLRLLPYVYDWVYKQEKKGREQEEAEFKRQQSGLQPGFPGV